jgi:8-oxo-dGTP diphosphatase
MMNKKTHVRCADMIANFRGKFVLIERQKTPRGLALPGGHIDPGENSREAAIREFKEETGLTLSDVQFVTRRKGKKRDPRYTMSQTSVYAGAAKGVVRNEEGLTKVVLLSKSELLSLPPERFAFDHHKILMQFLGK